MRKLFTALALLLCAGCMAQNMPVEKMERQWKMLYGQGCAAADNNDNTKAEQLLSQSVSLLKENRAEATNSYIYSAMKLAEVYYGQRRTEEQSALASELLSLKSQFRPGSKRYFNLAYCLSVYYSNTGQFGEAIKTIDEVLPSSALSAFPELKDKLRHRKALSQYCLGNVKEAIAMERLCVDESTGNKADPLQALAYFLYKDKDFKALEALLPQCFDALREPVLRKFNFSDAKERAAYWSKAGLFFTSFMPLYASGHPSAATTAYCYDAALFAKGVLLAASNKTSQLLLESGNDELLKVYDRYLSLKGNKQRSVDEEFEMRSLTDVFIRYQKEHKEEYRKDFRVRWTDVQKRLGEGGLAIEFVSSMAAGGSVTYYALALKAGYAAPHLIPVCSEESIRQAMKSSPEEFYSSPALYNLVWKALEPELEGTEKVWFSPTGLLYKLGIEYAQNEDGLSIGDLYSLNRLSSTRQLVLTHKPSDAKTATLYGGIKYDAAPATAADAAPATATGPVPEGQSVESSERLSNTTLRYAGARISYLPGTLEEVNGIGNVLSGSGFSVRLLTGGNGSEDSFKSIDSRDCRILHLATHGFYYSKNGRESRKDADALFRDVSLRFTGDGMETVDEDKMLSRSGLVLSGADRALGGKTLPRGAEDGILYADEIAAVNLNGVGLVALSACQSGLGDIADSEGVFGLQRSFKLAGASSLLMSLWKVDDNATRILMTEFYKNLVQGKSRHDALKDGQTALRLTDDGKYDSPAYWAAFVLLDGE